MADRRRRRPQGRDYARSVLKGLLVTQPEVTTLPRQKRPYCRMQVDVMGAIYDVDAYDEAAERCGVVLTGSRIRAICDLVQHAIKTPVERPRQVMALRLRQLKVLQHPQRGLA